MTETMRCRYVASDQPRVLVGRHQDECGDERCGGCLPCPMDHCRVCSVVHASGACPGCLAEVRENLTAIVHLCADLPAEVEHKGVEAEAMTLLAPAADPEAWGHVGASIASGRLPDGWQETADDERHPLFVLGSWESVYRDAFDQPSLMFVTIAGAATYLDNQLTAAGEEPWVPFDDMARDLRQCRSHLERVLHDGEQVEKGAPCPTCRHPLQIRYGARVVDDRWACVNNRCEVDAYTTTQYRGWVEDDALQNADRLTASDMERRFRDEDDQPLVKPGEVRVWGSRELVRKRGRNDQGITLYDVGDVERRVEDRLANRDCA